MTLPERTVWGEVGMGRLPFFAGQGEEIAIVVSKQQVRTTDAKGSFYWLRRRTKQRGCQGINGCDSGIADKYPIDPN